MAVSFSCVSELCISKRQFNVSIPGCHFAFLLQNSALRCAVLCCAVLCCAVLCSHAVQEHSNLGGSCLTPPLDTDLMLCLEPVHHTNLLLLHLTLPDLQVRSLTSQQLLRAQVC